MSLAPKPLGCHAGCREFGTTGVAVKQADDGQWLLLVPDTEDRFFSTRPYGLALREAYRLSTLDKLHTL